MTSHSPPCSPRAKQIQYRFNCQHPEPLTEIFSLHIQHLINIGRILLACLDTPAPSIMLPSNTTCCTKQHLATPRATPSNTTCTKQTPSAPNHKVSVIIFLDLPNAVNSWRSGKLPVTRMLGWKGGGGGGGGGGLLEHS